jgi:hypothetical protein
MVAVIPRYRQWHVVSSATLYVAYQLVPETLAKSVTAPVKVPR